jgi:predicted alpha/beta hydrolase
MAHGLGGERTWLAKFAGPFAEAGFAVVAFDYRHWGSSDGQPRQWISIAKQHADWASAVKHVQTQLKSVVDANRLSLWGTSFAGGHVIVVASKLPGQIKAVISNVSRTSAAGTMHGAAAVAKMPQMLNQQLYQYMHIRCMLHPPHQVINTLQTRDA